jgi:hypothetical protein
MEEELSFTSKAFLIRFHLRVHDKSFGSEMNLAQVRELVNLPISHEMLRNLLGPEANEHGFRELRKLLEEEKAYVLALPPD